MNTKVILFIFILFGSFAALSNNPPVTFSPENTSASKRIINANDSLIFDLANATITATYIDIPIYILSDDVIFAVDYGTQFNLSKLTFSTTIDLSPSTNTTVVSLAYFNPSDLYVRYTASSLQNFQIGVYISKIRFMLSAPCVSISAADFTNTYALLNGIQCSFRFTDLDFTQFIPTAGFSNSPACLSANVQFTDTSSIASGSITSWLWNFGNGTTSTLQNPSTIYTTTGTIAPTLIVTSGIGCSDTIAIPLTINQPPVSVFSYTFDCIKDSVFFTNVSTIPSGSIQSSLWNFGDLSNTSSQTDPTHHYNASGLYTVTLVSISNFSCTATSSLVVALNNKVSANFSNSLNNCLGAVINFSDASTYTVSAINAWNWDFGDGATSTQQNPSHTYAAAGVYSVTLKSTGADGCKGVITQTVSINAPPQVQFSVNNVTGCAVTPLIFNDLSTTAPGSSYLWDFGNGNTSTSQNPLYAYPVSGVYSVKLIVTAPGGCSDSLTKTSYLTINTSPAADFLVSSHCTMVNLNFADNTTISSGSITAWSWDFGDGHTSVLENPGNTYSVAGSYTVSLASTSNLGCVGTFTQVLVLSNKPIVDFQYTSGAIDCSGQTINLNNLSTPTTGPSYGWNFGDGGSSTLQSPVHTFSTGGSYIIELIVINPGGCADSLSKPYALSLPLAAKAFFTDTVISNAVVSFSNLSTNAVHVTWDFGDTQSANSDNPSHPFPDVETYKVCLTAYNSLDCPNSLCKDIYVGLSSIVAIPSNFTPNRDNVNDVLRVRGGPFTEMQFQILNEWGNLVFSSSSQNVGWDGSFKGEEQPVGVYEYIFSGKTVDEKNINLYGVVNLTR